MAESAPCREHGQAARETCARCGDFVCPACLIDTEALCPSCRALRRASGFPFSRANWGVLALAADAFASYRRERGPLILSALVTTVLFSTAACVGILSIFWEYGFAATPPPGAFESHMLKVMPAVYAFGALLMMVLARGCLDVAQRRPLELGRMLGVLRALPRIVAHSAAAITALGSLWFVLLGGLLLASRGLRVWLGEVSMPATVALIATYYLFLAVAAYLSCPVIFLPLELLHNRRAGPVRGLINAWTIAGGFRFRVLGLALLLGLFYYLACGLSVVGGFVALPALHLFHANVFLALRDGSGLPPVEAR